MRKSKISLGIVLALSLATLSCSSDGDSPMDPGGGGSIRTGTTTKSITAAGGDIATKTDNGVIVRLTFPPDAVRQDVAVTLRPGTPELGSWLNVAFEPAYRVFLEDVTVDIIAPEDMPVDEIEILWMGSVVDPWIMPTTVDIDTGSLRTTLRSFGVAAADSSVIQPLRAPAEAASPGSGNQMGASPMECKKQVANAEAAFDRFSAQDDFQNASRAAAAAAAALQVAGCPEVQLWLTSARQAACDGLRDAIINATTIAAEDFGLFNSLVGPVLYWSTVVQELGAPCSALDDVFTVIDENGSQFATFYDTGLNTIVDGDWRAYLKLRNEALAVWELYVQVLNLAADDAANQILTDVFYPTLDQLRAKAYFMGETYNWHYPLSRLTGAGFFAPDDVPGQAPVPGGAAGASYADFSDADIFADLQYCATSIDIGAFAASDTLYSESRAGGVAVGQRDELVKMMVPTRGTLAFKGKLAGFTCWLDIAADNEVVFAVEGQDVLSLRRSTITNEYLLNDWTELDIREMLLAVGQNPEAGDTYQLTATRLRTDCDQRWWGPEEYELFKLDMTLVGPNLEITDDLPAQIQPGQSVPVSWRVAIIDQFGIADYDDGVNVDVAVTGGTVTPSSGVTDANGFFNATLTPTGTANTGGAARASAATVSLDVAANTDGVNVQRSASVIVGQQGTANLVHMSHSGRVQIEGVNYVLEDEGYIFDPPSPGPWSWNSSVEADTTIGDLSFAGMAQSNVSTSLTVAGDVVTAFSGTISASATLTTSGELLAFVPHTSADGEPSISFDVVGGDVPYTLTASGSGSGDYEAWVQMGGGSLPGNGVQWNQSGSLSESGVLSPGSYSITGYAGSYLQCTNCSKTGSAQATFSLTLGSQ